MCIKITSMHVIARRLLTRKLMSESLCFSQRNFQQQTNINKLDHRLLDSQGTWLQLVARNYASKNNTFAYSGDLTMQKPLEPHAVLYNAKELTSSLQQASESVQRLSTVGYADGRERKTHYVEDIQDRIEDLFGVGADLELRIAKLTVDIRTVIPHCVKFRQDKKNKAQLVEKIQMRKKLLKYLRKEDYQRFLWLLRELRIRYVPIQEYHGHASKKFLKRSGTVKAAFNVRKQKLIELREQLDAERVDYEVYKQKALADIQIDIEKLCLDRNLLWKQQVRESMTKAEVKLLKKVQVGRT
ncbi:28S ribosomal protein S15, mitochondrial-like [Haliotis rubra]|uniref:28S ribosomal protein S15, mitochondrial-like n=1 Tax=Haliotis rubra TaxID=36100 RepID=UPI001EE53332|nr:28S ribosomal protein S15, mitochondrial-like [Haliotis rubra]